VGFKLCACTYSASSKLMPAVPSETGAITASLVFSFSSPYIQAGVPRGLLEPRPRIPLAPVHPRSHRRPSVHHFSKRAQVQAHSPQGRKLQHSHAPGHMLQGLLEGGAAHAQQLAAGLGGGSEGWGLCPTSPHPLPCGSFPLRSR